MSEKEWTPPEVYKNGIQLKQGDTLQVTSNLQIGIDGKPKTDPIQFYLNDVLFIRQTTAEAQARKAVREALEKVGEMARMTRAVNEYNSRYPTHYNTVHVEGHYKMVDNALSNITDEVNELLAQYQEPPTENRNETF